MFSGKELKDPNKHVNFFKLNVVSKQLPADVNQNVHRRLWYFAETLLDAASEWFN